MGKKDIESAPPNGKVLSNLTSFLFCYLLMSAGSVIGMLASDGFRWHAGWRAAYGYLVVMLVGPVFAYLLGPFFICYSLLAVFVEPSFDFSEPKNVCHVGGVFLCGLLSFLLLVLARYRSFGAYPPWQR